MLPWRRIAGLGLIGFALLFLPRSSPGQSQAPAIPAQQAASPVYNGEWWLSLGGWEQYGYVTGYEDCYASEYRGSAPFTGEVQSYIDALSKYFQADPSRRTQTVSQALDIVRNAAADKPAPPARGASAPAHAGFDGSFWFDADPAAELGFVEGYLACHTAKLKDADAKFSKPPADYVDLINQAYNITDDTDDVDAGKAPIKIADVLHRLQDQELRPAKPAS